MLGNGIRNFILMKKVVPIAILFVLIFSNVLFAQNSGVIEGIVTDSKTGKPLDAVNVYVGNSTFGTATNKKGHFTLRHIPPGVIQVIFTSLGYVSGSRKIILGRNGYATINMELKPQIYNMQAIHVRATHSREWEKLFREFKNEFIGSSSFADQCSIQNPGVLHFKIDKSGSLVANTRHRLVVVNKALGYKLYINLVSFKWNGDSGRYKIQPLFKKLKSSSLSQLAKWHRNRKLAYERSFRHFIYDLAGNKANKGGFYFNAGIKKLDNKQNLYQQGLRGIYGVTLTGFRIYSSITVHYKTYQSRILKTNHKYFFVDSNGNLLNPYAVAFAGDWGGYRVASMLPFNYRPSK